VIAPCNWRSTTSTETAASTTRRHVVTAIAEGVWVEDLLAVHGLWTGWWSALEDDHVIVIVVVCYLSLSLLMHGLVLLLEYLFAVLDVAVLTCDDLAQLFEALDADAESLADLLLELVVGDEDI